MCNGYQTVMFEGSGRGSKSNAVTRLIPDLKFTCDGIITQFTVGGAACRCQAGPGAQDPKIQVWRESPNQCGAYFKPVPDIVINVTACNGTVKMLSTRVYQCTLKDIFKVQVQAGDILGLELAPTNNDDFEVYFTDGEPINYVFQHELSSTAILSSRTNEIQEQPQISITVEASTFGSTATDNFVPDSHTDFLDENSNSVEVGNSNANLGLLVGSVVGGVVGIILLTAVVILILIVVYQSRKCTKVTRDREARTAIPQNISTLNGIETKANLSYIPGLVFHLISMGDNVAYGDQISTEDNVAYGEMMNQDSNGLYETIDPPIEDK